MGSGMLRLSCFTLLSSIAFSVFAETLVNEQAVLTETKTEHNEDVSISLWNANGTDGPVVANCTSGTELAAALANPVMQIIRIYNNILIVESDWASVTTPVLVRRNITITGRFPNPVDYPVLDLGLLRGKITLVQHVKVNITRIVLKGYRKLPVFQQSPGLDLVYSVEAGGTAYGTLDWNPGQNSTMPSTISVWIDQAAIIHNVCLPPNETFVSISTAPRAFGDTGKQQFDPRVTQPGADICTNDTTRWDLRRCWPAVGMYTDLSSNGYNINSSNGVYRRWYTGYAVHVTSTYFMCEKEMTADCIQKYDILGCLARMSQETGEITGAVSSETVIEANCSTGGEFAAAIANPAIQLIRVMSNIYVTDADWESIPVPVPVPVPLRRNLTVTGIPGGPVDYPVLDLGFVRGKIMLGLHVKLNITRVVLKDYRKPPLFQAPGLDLVYSVEAVDIVFGTLDWDSGQTSTAPSTISVWIDQAAIIDNVCLPPNETFTSISTAPRAFGDTGEQQFDPRVKQPGADICTNDTTRWDLRRCWPATGNYFEITTNGYNIKSSSGAYQCWYAGYAFYVINTYLMCEKEMTAECIQKYNILGCHARMSQETGGSAGGSAVTSSGGGSGGSGGGGDKSTLLAIVLPSVLGGCLVAAAGAGIVAWAVRRRRRRGDSGATSNASTFRGVAEAGGPMNADVKIEVGPAGEVCGGDKGSALGGDSGGVSRGDSAGAADGENKGGSKSEEKALMKTCTAAGADNKLCASSKNGPSARRSSLGHGVAGKPPFRCNDDEVALIPVTVLTPLRPVINLGVKLDSSCTGDGPQVGATIALTAAAACPSSNTGSSLSTGDSAAIAPGAAGQVRLLPNQTLGSGAYGKVVVGVYHGKRVAVKLLNTGMTVDGRAPGAAPAEYQRGEAHGAAVTASDGGSGGEASEAAWWSQNVPAAAQALAQEVAVLARCQHPNIVRLLAACLEPPRVCLVMELMDTSLEDMMYCEGKVRVLPLPVVVHIGMQIARALSYLHPTILHRDLKPANVLISQPTSEKPIAKLADFGMSRLLNTVLITMNPEVGTAPYMAPETFDTMNTIITDRADIYSLGVLLWEMLAIKRPWEGLSMFQIAYNVAINRAYLPLDDIILGGRCPPKLAALMIQCWDRDPLRRPAAAEVVKLLALAYETMS